MAIDPVVGSRIGAGKEADVFASGDGVLKLYKPGTPKRSAFREAAALALVESLGLPAPRVHAVYQMANGRWVIAMSRADGPSFAEAIAGNPGLLDAYLRQMALLHLRVHGHPATRFPDAKAGLAMDISNARILGADRQEILLRRLGDMPRGEHLCHGDFHPYNILGPPDCAVIIDWPNAARGDPAADVCRSYVLIRSVAPEMAGAYVDAYAAVSRIDAGEVWSWLPVIAAARLAEGVPDEEADLLKMVDDGLA